MRLGYVVIAGWNPALTLACPCGDATSSYWCNDSRSECVLPDLATAEEVLRQREEMHQSEAECLVIDTIPMEV